MAPGPIQRLASLIHKSSQTISVAESNRAASKSTSHLPAGPARPKFPASQLPASLEKIVKDVCQYEPIELAELPPVITNNPLWWRIYPLVKEAYIVFDSEPVSALLVKLHGSELQLVFKILHAGRIAGNTEQVQAEIDAAESFAWHPLMGTLVAACYDDEGNFCSVMPYAGCTLISILNHPDWFTVVPEQDRLEFARLFIQQHLMVFNIMQHTGVGHYYRDVKPANCCFNPTSGLVSVIDYGLKVWANLENFHDGETPGYFTPELVNPGPDGKFATRRSVEKKKNAMTNTTDVFLIGFVGVEAAVGLDGLPWQLMAKQHNINDIDGFIVLVKEHAAAAAAGYGDLIARVPCPVAQDFFRHTMCSDPEQRPTPAEALKHEWLAGSRATVEQAVAAATPAYQQQNQQIAELFAGVPGVILPQQQPQQLSAALNVCSATIYGDSLHDVARSPELSSCSEHSNSLATSSVCSNGPRLGDTAAGDQLQAASVTAAAAKKKASLLQRGRKLLSKLSQRSMNVTSDKSCDSNRAPRRTGVDTAEDKEQGAEAITIVVEPCAVSVPGWCGIRWCWKNKRST